MFGPSFTSSSFNLTKILGGISKTLGIVNQAIPIVQEVRPMVSNARKLMNVLNEIKVESKPAKTTSKKSPEKKEVINAPSSNITNQPVFFQ